MQTIGAMVTELKYRLDIETFEHLAAKELLRNEIFFLNIATAERHLSPQRSLAVLSTHHTRRLTGESTRCSSRS